MILVDTDLGSTTIAGAHLIPAVEISSDDGLLLASYMNSTKSPVVSMSAVRTTYDVKPSPTLAGFSSRGPSLYSPEILKPDILAPGANILAAYTEASSPSYLDADKRRVPYTIMSGKSMSCPHVAGVVGLLRDNTGGPIIDSNGNETTPLSIGAGHIRPNRAAEPGLVYDDTVADYLTFLCGLEFNSTQVGRFTREPFACPATPPPLEDLNYPSISAPSLIRTLTVTHRLMNVGQPGTYRVRCQAPTGVAMTVRPQILRFSKVGEEEEFKVRFESWKDSIKNRNVYGRMVCSDGKH